MEIQITSTQKIVGKKYRAIACVVYKQAVCYPYLLHFWGRGKNTCCRKKIKPDQTNRTTGFKFTLVIAKTLLFTKFELFGSMCPHIGGLIFFTQIFPHFCLIFDTSCPVQVNGENFQAQNFVFLTSELKSTLNFRLENIIFIFWQTFLFSQYWPQNVSQSLNSVINIFQNK